jgi:hypothetical protein
VAKYKHGTAQSNDDLKYCKLGSPFPVNIDNHEFAVDSFHE